VWTALKYLGRTDAEYKIPSLKGGETEAEDDREQAALFLQTFFPPQPEPDPPISVPREQGESGELDDSINFELLETEVQHAIFGSNPRKAPGPDGLPFRVWQELWPGIKGYVLELYRASVRLQHLPVSWAEAKIVVIPKPGKPDYTAPDAYRPISLLRTLSKGLEKVMARRISEYLERTNKLPRTQFGARPRRSSEQELTILVERIYAAWRQKKVLSLLTFDVQGAYNGVNKNILFQRMSAVGIPTRIARWVYSFCNACTACVSLNEYCSETAPIEQPGLPQGSPLSPILYIIYNASLLTGEITAQHGDIGFVDDYSAWVVGESADTNTMTLQEHIIPRVTSWEKQSGATFQARKTQFIHFTRIRARATRPWKALQIREAKVAPSATAKVLGVYLDSELRMSQHFDYVARKATKQAVLLGSLRGLRPRITLSSNSGIQDGLCGTSFQTSPGSTVIVRVGLTSVP
jgi:hypothetical protein